MYVEPFTVHRFAKRIESLGLPRLAKCVMLVGNWIFSSSVPLSAAVGERSVCEHRGIGVVIHPEAVIGHDVHILPHVVLGGRGKGFLGAPTICDGVTLGTGAKVIGPVTVGSNAHVGANAVVLEDVPPGATAVGVPARILRGGDERV